MPKKKAPQTPKGTIKRNLFGSFKTPEEATAQFLREIAKEYKTDDPKAYVEVLLAEPPERKEDFWLIHYLKKEQPAKPVSVPATGIISNPVQASATIGGNTRPSLSKLMVPLTSIVISGDNPRTSWRCSGTSAIGSCSTTPASRRRSIRKPFIASPGASARAATPGIYSKSCFRRRGLDEADFKELA